MMIAGATYMGPIKELQGQGAILLIGVPIPFPVGRDGKHNRKPRRGDVGAQFNNRDTGYAYGWHAFPGRHFQFRKTDQMGPGG